jgi:hypothetical protein
MSLTSYRAAPPRVQRNSEGVVAATSTVCVDGFLPDQIAEGDLSRVRGAQAWIRAPLCILLFAVPYNTKGPLLSGPLVSAGPKNSFREDYLLRFADLAATDSPAS